MTTDHASTPAPQASPIVEGLRLHALARSSLQYCEHELALLNDEGLPIYTREEVESKIKQSLVYANELQETLRKLCGLANPSLLPIDPATDGELVDACKAVQAVSSESATVGARLYGAIVGAAIDGHLDDADVVAIARTLVRGLGTRKQNDGQIATVLARRVLDMLAPMVAKVATDTRFGDADVQGRVRRLLEHPTTIAEVAAELRRAEAIETA